MGTSTTLRWTPTELARRELMAPGGPFAVTDADVLGTRNEVFVQRPPHLRALLEQSVSRFGDRPYLVHDGGELTFAETSERVASAASVLVVEHGIGPGDHVAIASANRYEYVVLAWAVISLGGVVVGLNGWWTAAELRHGLELSEPRLVLGDAPRLERLRGLATGAPQLDIDDVCPEWFAVAAELPTTAIDEDDPFVILFTSGTTGRAKGAVLTHRNNLHWIQAIQLRTAAAGIPSRTSCEIAAMPLFHVGGLNNQAIASAATGTTLVYPPPGRWSEQSHLSLSERHRVTNWRLVPTQAWRLLDHPDLDRFDLSSLRGIAGGGSTWPPALLEQMAAAWPQARAGLINGYGMTETSGTGASATMPDLLERPGTVGGPPPTGELRVCTPGTDEPAVDGDVGEVQIRSASVFVGYHRDPDATAAALTSDRWYRTGDFGRIVGGQLHLDGRRTDLIIRGGENIYPREIEDRLAEHPDVAEVVVVGVPHRDLGHEVKAVVVRRAGRDVDAAAIQRWVAVALAPFKVPAHVEFRDEIPHNETGKVLRRLLLDESSADGPSTGFPVV